MLILNNVTSTITHNVNSELPNLKNNTNIHFLRLFYVAAFSTTFKLLKTKFLILATHCTNKSKSAEPRAEQRPLDCYAEARKLFSEAKERRFLLISLTKLQMIWILCNCKIASVHDCAI